LGDSESLPFNAEAALVLVVDKTSDIGPDFPRNKAVRSERRMPAMLGSELGYFVERDESFLFPVIQLFDGVRVLRPVILMWLYRDTDCNNQNGNSAGINGEPMYFPLVVPAFCILISQLNNPPVPSPAEGAFRRKRAAEDCTAAPTTGCAAHH